MSRAQSVPVGDEEQDVGEVHGAVGVQIGGAVRPSTTLAWDAVPHPDLVGYRIYWRDTTAPQWEHSRFVGLVDRFTLENLVIDNYLFGVAAVSATGTESVVAFPTAQLRE